MMGGMCVSSFTWVLAFVGSQKVRIAQATRFA